MLLAGSVMFNFVMEICRVGFSWRTGEPLNSGRRGILEVDSTRSVSMSRDATFYIHKVKRSFEFRHPGIRYWYIANTGCKHAEM